MSGRHATSHWRFVRIERNTTVVATPGVKAAERVAITFDFWRDADDKAFPQAYAESYFARRDIEQVHVFAHWNHFFEVEEVERVVLAVDEVAAAATSRILYGTSMGAYAALRFAGTLRGDIVIAVAPHLQPSATDDAKAISDYHATLSPDQRATAQGGRSVAALRLPPRTYVLYDPEYEADARVVDALRAHHELIPIECLHAGHWPDLALRKAGLLSSVITRAIDGTLERPARFDLSDPWAP